MSDGKKLEALVKFIESVLLPENFEVETRERVLDDDGRQIAEFDVFVRGKVGSTDFTWLIECRDRPSSGPAPGSWIEQLVGRRDRFSINKVTAVSTTGFAPGAIEHAQSRGIELREVRAVAHTEFKWIEFGEITVFKMISELKWCRLLLKEGEDPQLVAALQKRLSGSEPVLLRTSQGGDVTLHEAFRAAVKQAGDCFTGLLAGQSRTARIDVAYPVDQFEVATSAGAVKLPAIRFAREIRMESQTLPMVSSKRYKRISDSEPISQLAALAPIETESGSFSLEFHRMGEDGETLVILRRMAD
jgi:hypothetical protein